MTRATVLHKRPQ